MILKITIIVSTYIYEFERHGKTDKPLKKLGGVIFSRIIKMN